MTSLGSRSRRFLLYLSKHVVIIVCAVLILSKALTRFLGFCEMTVVLVGAARASCYVLVRIRANGKINRLVGFLWEIKKSVMPVLHHNLGNDSRSPCVIGCCDPWKRDSRVYVRENAKEGKARQPLLVLVVFGNF